MKKLLLSITSLSMLFYTSMITTLAEDNLDEETLIIEDNVNEESSTETEIPEEIEEETTEDTAVVSYPAGVTVAADENSATGYTAHFVFDPASIDIPQDAEIENVEIHGSFRLLSGDADESEGTDHSLYEYVNGDYVANVHPYTRSSGQSGIWGAEWIFELELIENQNLYILDVPMISGAHYYYYTINFTDGTSLTTDDPANPSGPRINEAYSDSETGDITHSTVYGIWDPVKQSETPNLDYMREQDSTLKGTAFYVEYTGNISDHQDLGIYLPAGYDPDREQPYRVIYLSHGMGGNETYWFTQPQGKNVMDAVITENPDQEAIVVAMDNTLYSWNYELIGDNVVNYIIPYIEANYNVSSQQKDRAFAGFSMGAMTSTYMTFHYPEVFGYFGIFSGCNIGNATFKEGFEYNGSILNDRTIDNSEAYAYLQEVYANIEADPALYEDVVFTMAGNVDTAVYANGFNYYGAYETIRDWMAANMPEGHFVDGGLVPGSHDVYTWAQCLYTFAKDVVWTNNTTDDEPVDPVNPIEPEKPEEPEDPVIEPDTPETPEKPANPKPNTGSKENSSSPKTADYSSYQWNIAGLIILSAGIAVLIQIRRKFSRS